MLGLQLYRTRNNDTTLKKDDRDNSHASTSGTVMMETCSSNWTKVTKQTNKPNKERAINCTSLQQ